MIDGAAQMEQSAVGSRPSADDGGLILEVDGVVKRFGGILAVDGATFEVAKGSVTALIGPNGAGKTTLFNVITGFYGGDRGSIRFEGREVVRRPPHMIARLGMVRTFQITKALAKMPVIDNMMLAAPDQPGERLYNLVLRPAAARAREREVRARAEELLDEPMAGINPTLGARLLEHMHQLRTERGMTFLLIEHDMEVVMGHSDKVIVMAEGRVIAQGPPAEVRHDQRVIDAYLGAHHDTELSFEEEERILDAAERELEGESEPEHHPADEETTHG